MKYWLYTRDITFLHFWFKCTVQKEYDRTHQLLYFSLSNHKTMICWKQEKVPALHTYRETPIKVGIYCNTRISIGISCKPFRCMQKSGRTTYRIQKKRSCRHPGCTTPPFSYELDITVNLNHSIYKTILLQYLQFELSMISFAPLCENRKFSHVQRSFTISKVCTIAICTRHRSLRPVLPV